VSLSVGVLGSLAAWDGGREVELGNGRQRALLALLALHPNEPIPSDRLVDALWEGRPPASGAKVLQGYVSQLRRALGAEAIATRGSTYELRVSSVDAAELDARVRAGEPHQALALWRGEPLAEFAYETWAQPEIQRLTELRLVALEQRLESDLAHGAGAQLVPELESLVAEHPLRERLRAQLMLALYRAGRQSDALAVYAEGRRMLVDELGVEPGPELQDLQRRVLAHDPEIGAVRGGRVFAPARRPGVLAAVGAALVLAAAAALAVTLSRGNAPSVDADALALVAPSGRSVAARTSFAAPQSELALGGGFIWTLAGDSGTITSIDARTHRQLATFAPAGRAADITYGDGAFWILAQQPPAVVRFDPSSQTATESIPLPGFVQGEFRHRPGQRSLAYGGGGLWALDGGGSAYRVDPRSRVVTRLRVSDAVSVLAGAGAVWIATGYAPGTAAAVRVDPRTGEITKRTPVPATVLSSFAVGGGAIWVPDLFTGEVWQVRGGAIRATSVGPGATSVAFSNGAAWVGNEITDTLVRIDPASARITRIVRAPAPQDIEATRAGPLVLSGPAVVASALPGSTCGPLQFGGSGAPRLIIASDLDFHGRPLAATLTANAVGAVLRGRRYRAGGYTVGYQSCDDSSALAGRWDPARCDANASLYAKTRKVIGVVGTSDSGCAGEELPLLNQAPGGPVALVSPATTFDFLTRTTPGVAAGMLGHLYPTHRRNFARVIAPEATQVAAAALLAHQLGLRTVAIVADDDGTVVTRAHVAWFRYSAARLHLATVVVPTSGASRVRADGVFIASDAGGRAGAVIAALRRHHGSRFPVIGTDYLAPTAAVWATGSSTAGTYVVTGEPLSNAAIRRNAQSAATALLRAIARSNGTRSSVVHELHADPSFAANGDPSRAAVTVLRIGRVSGVPDPDFAHTVVDRVLRPPVRIVHP
jgi:DNA-binding SARP family transcriptional activator